MLNSTRTAASLSSLPVSAHRTVISPASQALTVPSKRLVVPTKSATKRLRGNS